jgi:hypothetical protein
MFVPYKIPACYTYFGPNLGNVRGLPKGDFKHFKTPKF